MASYVTPKVYGGYTYTRGNALVVKGNYYTAVNNSSASGSFSSNTTKYFYGYYTPDSGTVLNPLALMNSSSQNSVTFGFMRMEAIQSGGTANTYTLTLNGNGGTFPQGTSFTMTYKSGNYNSFNGWNIPTRSGYRFKGIYTASSGGTQIYNANGVCTMDGTYFNSSSQWIYQGNKTLYAQWVAIYYLDLNVYLNGSVINNTNIFHCDVTVGGTTQASNVCDYYRQHDTGSSWSVTGLTTASGYTRYSTGTTSGTLKSATSCNVYIGQNYTITYNANGGSGATTQAVNYGTAWTTKGAICSKTGYTQTSWNTAANGTGTTYSLNTAQTNKQASNLTLYAIYTANSYPNTINHWTWGYKNSEGNNGSKNAYSLGKTTFTGKYGNSYALSADRGVTIPNGFSLNTVGTSYISGSWTTYNIGQTFTQGASGLSCDYNYNPITYSITYTMNGGTNNSANPSSYNVLYGVTFSAPTRAGYTFSKWTNSSGATITGINVGANATFSSVDDLRTKLASRTTGNQTVTANWTANKYTVTYDANGGYNTNQTQSVTYNSNYTTKGAIFAKPHYVQTGWNTKQDGSGTSYALNTSVKYSTIGDLTLYAQYRALTTAEKDIYLYNDGSIEAVAYAKTSDIYGFAGGVVCAKDFTIGAPASSPSKTMQFTAMKTKDLS